MKKTRVINTTPLAGVQVQLAAAVLALFSVYYRMPLLFLLLILYLFYLVWSYYWTLISCRSTVGESSAAPANVFAGEVFSRDFKFSNGWRFPLVRCGISFLLPPELTCSSAAPMAISKLTGGNSTGSSTTLQIFPVWDQYTVVYAWLPEKKEVAVRLQVNALSRGVYYLPPPCLYVGDPSGLFRGLNQVGREHYLYVFPNLELNGDIFKILDFKENNREDNVGLEDRYQARGVRDYQITDAPKSINWYATARTNSLKTNIYQRQDSEFCLVVFDLSVSCQPISSDNPARHTDPLLEKAISMAAGIALFHLEQGAMTAFYTNAPTLQWKVKDSGPQPGKAAYMKRINQITALDFSAGTRQAQNILKLCASIDETSRATPESQQKLWSKIQEVPANTLIYLLTYHDPPENWLKAEEYSSSRHIYDPSAFYNPQKLADLASSRVRLINLSKERLPK